MGKVFKSWDRYAYSEYERAILEQDLLDGGGDGRSGSEAAEDPATILAEARERAEAQVQEAYAEGLRRGHAAGIERFNESVGRTTEMLASAAEAVKQAREEFVASIEPQLGELVETIVSRILHKESEQDPALVQRTVRAALEELFDRERVILHVNPKDLATVREYKLSLLEAFTDINELEVHPDEAVESGGCIAETPTIQIDARLQSQIKRLIDAAF